jgi:hypothetical protein
MNIKKHIEMFTRTKINNDNIYNEFSLQHELGFYLREELKSSKVEFERNVKFFSDNQDENFLKKFVKKEMDIVVYKGNSKNLEKYAIELKYPTNGAYPRRMFQFVKDIKFMEQVKDELGFTKTYCLTLISDSQKGIPFRYCSRKNEGEIYHYFRNNKEIHGKITNPLNISEVHDIKRKFSIEWQRINHTNFWYYLLEI